MLSALFSSFANFFETSYIVVKKTEVNGSVAVATEPLTSVFLSIPLFGLNGAGLASMLGFLTTFLFRVKDTQKFVVIQIKWRTFISNFVIILVQILCLFYLPSKVLYLCLALLFCGMLVVNQRTILYIIMALKNKK